MQHTAVDIKNFFEEDGTLHEGKLLHFYRKKVMAWTNAQTLTDLYNEFMNEGEEVSVRWIQRMEKKHDLPPDAKRRWILATLLSIPSTYLGLTLPEPRQPGSDTFHLPLSAHTPVLDLAAYKKRLREIWSAPYAVLDEVFRRVYLLQEEVLYGETQPKEDVVSLLCEYLLVAGNIQRAQGYLSSAMVCLNKAITLMKGIQNPALRVKVLYVRGFVFFDMWGIQQDRADQTNLLHAVNDFSGAYGEIREAKQQKHGVSQPLQGAVCAELGLASAYTARDGKDRKHALDLIDTTGKMVAGKDFHDDPYFLHVNEEWYTIDKAEAYLALRWPKSALNILEEITPTSPTRQRYVYADILEARANIACDRLEIGTICAEEALAALATNRSTTFLTLLAHMYTALKQERKYTKSPDVARLGVKLLQVQHPELFV